MLTPDLDKAPIAPPGSLGGVPVIDFSQPADTLVEQIGRACRDWGFFQIVGHRVSADLTRDILATARAFFLQPREEKRCYLRSRDNPWGYYDRELTKEQRDRKEVFDVGPEIDQRDPSSVDPFDGETPWPRHPADFERTVLSWAGEMRKVSNQLIGLIGGSLTGDLDRLRPAFEPAHTSYLRLNYYPVADPLAGEVEQESDLGIHHHTDAGALTVLLQDGVSGLQVYRDGHWHDVPAIPGAFTINIGDMTQVWSNDAYRAPIHRVLAMDRQERLSIPYFYNPAYEVAVQPLSGDPLYAPIPWGEFRRRRAEGDFADYGQEVQIAEYRLG